MIAAIDARKRIDQANAPAPGSSRAGDVNRNDPVLQRALAALRMDDELTVRYQLDALSSDILMRSQRWCRISRLPTPRSARLRSSLTRSTRSF